MESGRLFVGEVKAVMAVMTVAGRAAHKHE
jgi:hypothetical protein